MKLNKKPTTDYNPLKPKFPKVHLDKNRPVMYAFTDGGCSGNGKKENTGAWGWVLLSDWDKIYTDASEKCMDTTNNQMELQAIIQCLLYVKNSIPDTTQVLLHTDSQYCLHGISTWRYGWIKKNWKNVKNVELWKILSDLVDSLPNVQYKFVRAHQEDASVETKWNNYVDQLCQDEIGYNNAPIAKDTSVVSEPDALLIAVHREIWKDTVFQKCSHGLVGNIQEYLRKQNLIEQSPKEIN